MLTGDLVRARTRKGILQPIYIDPNDAEVQDVARTMLDIFARHVDRPRRLLDAELRDFLGNGTTFVLHRGLAKLLRDRCEFSIRADAEPGALRQRVFEAAAATYRDRETLRFDRGAVLASVANEMELVAGDVEKSLYADLKAEQVLERFKSCTANWLLERYNVALAQAVLLRATSLEVVVKDQTAARYRELFRKIKFFRLLHDINVVAPGHYQIRLDGPLSLFRSSQRYGLQMAQFLPALLYCTDWHLDARVLWGAQRREVTYRLSPAAGLQPIGHSAGQWAPPEMAWLQDQFQKLRSDWSISVGGELLDLGGQGVLAPDYVFKHRTRGVQVFMEVLGFWRRGSVESRLELLRRHGPKNMILALSKELHVDEGELTELPGEIYVFRSAPLAREVVTLLEGFTGLEG